MSKRSAPVAVDKKVFHGDQKRRNDLSWPEPPPWRRFDDSSRKARGQLYKSDDSEITAVNAAIYLRRPLLITGRPGVGKTSLAYAVANELGLDEVLVWPITSRSTLQQGLYQYDAIGRLHDASMTQRAKDAGGTDDIGRYLTLGPLGAAFRCSERDRPRVLLIDEIDKSDLDLPNDLLHIFEEGEFVIPELARLANDDRHIAVQVGVPDSDGRVSIERGRVRCTEFPIVFLTSNGERDFPPAFLRRCIRLDILPPDADELTEIVRRRLGPECIQHPEVKKLISSFVKARDGERRQVATDQLLNAASLVMQGLFVKADEDVTRFVLRDLSDMGT